MSITQQKEFDDLKRYTGTKYREYLKNEESDTLYFLANSIGIMANETNTSQEVQQLPYKIRNVIMYKYNNNPPWMLTNAIQDVVSLIHNCQSRDSINELLHRIDPIAEDNNRLNLLNIQLIEQITQLQQHLQRPIYELTQMNLEQNNSLNRIEEQMN